MSTFFSRTDVDAKIQNSRWRWAAMAALLVALAASTTGIVSSSHADGPGIEEGDGWLNFVDYYVGTHDEIVEIRARLLAELDEAEHRIDTAIAGLDDEEIEQALVDAANRGVRVRVVADEHLEESGQFDVLVEHNRIDVAFGDGELTYLPEPHLSPILEFCVDEGDHTDCTNAQLSQQENTDGVMVRPSDYNVMSHTFFLIDNTYVWNISAPLTDEQRIWPTFRAMSEELANSFEREFRQMHGGVFSTTLSVYNGPLKSVTHQDPLRLTNRGQLRVRFNPQERLVKNVVDEVLRARASVFVMSENVVNEDLIAALQYKADNDFEVRVMHGQGQAQSVYDQLEGLDPVEAPAEMGRLPTMVVIDSERDRNGNRQPRLVQMLSHELWRAQPFEVVANLPANRVLFYPSDTFADGVMWEIVESGFGSQRNPEADRFIDTWESMWQEAHDE